MRRGGMFLQEGMCSNPGNLAFSIPSLSFQGWRPSLVGVGAIRIVSCDSLQASTDFFIVKMVRPCSSLSKLSTTHDSLIPSTQILNVSSDGDNASILEQEEFLDDAIPIAGYGDAFSDQDYNDNEGDESSGYGGEPSDHDDDEFSRASPINISGNLSRSSRRNGPGLTMRDSLLAEAWNRRKELALKDELANLKEHPMPHLLGRSSSDCSAAASMLKHIQYLLNRSTSDVGKSSSPPVFTTRTLTRSLTDDDFEELKGFMDLGFRFNEASLPAFSHTLPALEVYCAVAQSLQESPYCPSPAASSAGLCSSAPTTPQWKVCSPGDSSDDVKGRLRHWARAVACNVRLCY
ncbi:hypothetical protein GOP47_0026611 [Adiantum capillus-veneris]|nr:hypothetical protein GOP47_0026611 [Adiantum capillus-veneris]